ncbi:hypothetical protein A0J61_08727 [Choanephora cucurbitarum]|uniref:Uncharacterized protein n=1 Tax=Choanephora cucurbitarum TaxID=101091 RepID=A0A1C7N2I9_9FUNG|nr:hypothetical protein A0J61_08727 [Choanephora cucurbitarum]
MKEVSSDLNKTQKVAEPSVIILVYFRKVSILLLILGFLIQSYLKRSYSFSVLRLCHSIEHPVGNLRSK